MMQRRVYFVKVQTNEVMALPVMASHFYNTALGTGWSHCTRKVYEQGLMKRRLLTGKNQLPRAA